jgi:hypothetical protein
MLREVSLLVIGALLIVADAVDIVWTTLGTHGGGPISGRVTSYVWKAMLAIHKRWPNHRVLSFAGSLMLVLLLAIWILMLWTGWVFVFSARDGAIVETQTHHPATLASRIYFVGYALSTMGNGDFMPSTDKWRLVVTITTLGGLGMLTLAITFLLNVLPGVVHQRMIGAYITDLGATPQQIVARSWDGAGFDSLNDHLLELTGMVHLFTEHHLAYPVLHYFHSEQERTAATLRLAALHETLVLIDCGADKSVRLKPQVCLPILGALEGLREVMSAEFVDPAEIAPPAPPLTMLSDFGIPTVDSVEYGHGLERLGEARRFFAGLLRDDGREWKRVSGG